ncbi:hypothetical protein LguiB_035332 [Lonicera macranthoides]
MCVCACVRLSINGGDGGGLGKTKAATVEPNLPLSLSTSEPQTHRSSKNFLRPLPPTNPPHRKSPKP